MWSRQCSQRKYKQADLGHAFFCISVVVWSEERYANKHANAGVDVGYTESHESIPILRETSEPATRKQIVKVTSNARNT